MPERISALANCYQPGHYGSPGITGVSIELVPDLSLWQVAAWPETMDRVESEALLSVNGRSAVMQEQSPLNYTIRGQLGTLLRIEPLKWWILDVTPRSPEPTVGTILDLSHSRVRLRVRGLSASALLNRYLPLDLRSTEHDRVMSTAIHHVGVTLWQNSQGFELFIPRGFAESILELLCVGAEQFGYELR